MALRFSAKARLRAMGGISQATRFAGRALRPQRNVLADGAVIVDADQGCTLMGVL